MTIAIKKFFPKDPNSVKDYEFKWTHWLQIDEIISSFVLVHSVGITIVSSNLSTDNKRVIVWVSGGTETQEWCTCRITTSGGRVEDATMGFNIEDQ